jgi:hypothetical protein
MLKIFDEVLSWHVSFGYLKAFPELNISMSQCLFLLTENHAMNLTECHETVNHAMNLKTMPCT